MTETTMQQVMAAYREWRQMQDLQEGSEIPYQAAECPEFGMEIE